MAAPIGHFIFPPKIPFLLRTHPRTIWHHPSPHAVSFRIMIKDTFMRMLRATQSARSKWSTKEQMQAKHDIRVHARNARWIRARVFDEARRLPRVEAVTVARRRLAAVRAFVRRWWACPPNCTPYEALAMFDKCQRRVHWARCDVKNAEEVLRSQRVVLRARVTLDMYCDE